MLKYLSFSLFLLFQVALAFGQKGEKCVGTFGKFSISCDSIKNTPYDSNTTVLQVVAREILARKTFQASYHLEHTDLEEYYSNFLGLPVDSLRLLFPKDTFIKVITSLYRPLFTHKGDKEIPKWNKPTVDFNYQLIPTHVLLEQAVVIVDKAEVFYLRRNRQGYWRLYSWSSISTETEPNSH